MLPTYYLPSFTVASTINAKAKTSQDSCLNNFLAGGTMGEARNKRQAGRVGQGARRRVGIRRKLLSTAKARPKTTTSRVATWRRHCWRAKFWFDEFITFDVQTRKTAAGHKTSRERQTFDKRHPLQPPTTPTSRNGQLAKTQTQAVASQSCPLPTKQANGKRLSRVLAQQMLLKVYMSQ